MFPARGVFVMLNIQMQNYTLFFIVRNNITATCLPNHSAMGRKLSDEGSVGAQLFADASATAEQIFHLRLALREAKSFESVSGDVYGQLFVKVVEADRNENQLVVGRADESEFAVGVKRGVVVVDIHEVEEAAFAYGVLGVA